MTAKKPIELQQRRGPRQRIDAKRPTQYCTRPGCGATFRRKLDVARPCHHCGAPTTQDAGQAGGFSPSPPARELADYERHSLVIAGRREVWTEERIAAVLRAARNEVRDAQG